MHFADSEFQLGKLKSFADNSSKKGGLNFKKLARQVCSLRD